MGVKEDSQRKMRRLAKRAVRQARVVVDQGDRGRVTVDVTRKTRTPKKKHKRGAD